MAFAPSTLFWRLIRLLRVATLGFDAQHWRYWWLLRRSPLFDVAHYRDQQRQMHWLYRLLPRHHYICYGEASGLSPNADFAPLDYLQLNEDLQRDAWRPFKHYLLYGRQEQRVIKSPPAPPDLPACIWPQLRFDPDRPKAAQAIVLHLYYADLWPEFRDDLEQLDIDFDLYVSLTWHGPETADLAQEISQAFPRAFLCFTPNRGRDLLPFLLFVNSGCLEGYHAVAKLHGKKSPHRQDGVTWRRDLVTGILQGARTGARLRAFLADPDAAIWVADGQHLTEAHWWGSNRATARDLLARLEIDLAQGEAPSFPAGSIYWLKPLMLRLLQGLRLGAEHFEHEQGQLDGTLAHALERVLGGLAAAAGQKIRQTHELQETPQMQATRPQLVSAFYLPQFHPTPDNDRWWGRGFTEWPKVVGARSQFAGHLQPMLPGELGYYDLRVPEAMAAQTALARGHGIDAFCVYHYWFDGKRQLEAPMEMLLQRPEIDFPFYLAWANESWRRNWDGLSGEVLEPQSYQPGFEAALAADLRRFMQDPRYLRPDGTRPRLVIYRPDDLPDPTVNIARLRRAFRALGIGEVELGAVRFHLPPEKAVAADLFDFWIEMPPHGLVQAQDLRWSSALNNHMPVPVAAGFAGLIYDYAQVARHALDPAYRATLPANTIAGIMPSWDNSARRDVQAHIAYGANPARFAQWLTGLLGPPLQGSYRQEIIINAWNEWGEKAMMEPSQIFGRANLEVLRDRLDHAAPAMASLPAAPVARAS